MGNLLRDTVELLRLRKAGKRELLRIPRDEMAIALHEGWVERFWNLPPEAWTGAIDLRIEGSDLRKAGDAAKWNDYRAREREFWRQYEDAPAALEEPESFAVPPTAPVPCLTAEEIEELRRISEKVSEEMKISSAEPPVLLDGKMLHAAERIKQAEGLIHAPLPPLGEPFDAWIASLPDEAHDEARLACLLWRDMIRLRSQLKEAIEERRVLAGIHEEEARYVLAVRMFTLRGKIDACERHFLAYGSFFERYGKPPLVEVN